MTIYLYIRLYIYIFCPSLKILLQLQYVHEAKVDKLKFGSFYRLTQWLTIGRSCHV